MLEKKLLELLNIRAIEKSAGVVDESSEGTLVRMITCKIVWQKRNLACEN